MTIFEIIQVQINEFLGQFVHMGSSGISQIALLLGWI